MSVRRCDTGDACDGLPPSVVREEGVGHALRPEFRQFHEYQLDAVDSLVPVCAVRQRVMVVALRNIPNQKNVEISFSFREKNVSMAAMFTERNASLVLTIGANEKDGA